eukprot:CAMPEP_0197241226 /NCGR_PEP_ID=MMETSP1429-20130617/7321_1 /TAXON_ID=49237 /ORGANISM="Chaetoceros  sp., Strain UNC1202" /LENGTH=253 /DNA_ID=CAMNT_0042701029 /DNA_START=243 /DNA_END=1001 /DNA_ORIENTATION=+
MSEAALNDLWKFDAVHHTWEEIKSGVGAEAEANDNDACWPDARSFHRMIAVGQHLYVFGGCGTSGRLADLYQFDTVGKTWTSHGSAPDGFRGRGGANLVQTNPTTLAVVAGFAGEEMGDAILFDTAAESWADKRIVDCVSPRSVCISATVECKSGQDAAAHHAVLIFGGEVCPSDKGHEGAGNFANDLVVLGADGDHGDVTVKTKTILTQNGSSDDYPEWRGWSDGDACDNTLFFFGGLTGDDDSPKRLDDLW